MIKKRYDNLVSNSQSLKRIFSGSNSSKYPTLGKFLPSFSKQQVVFSNNEDASANDGDLDLVDQLINQTLLQREVGTTIQDQASNIPATGRAKEILRNDVVESSQGTEPAVEANLESSADSNPESGPELPQEVIANPELAELSKEIQEVSKETKEQREQAMIKEKQQEITNLATEASVPVAVSNKPVVVLPITAKSKEEAKFKTTKYSVRWLLEWCKKIAKMVSGAVVYKEEVDYE